MSEQWEYRRAQVLWLCDLPRSLVLAVLVPTLLALVSLLPALLTLPFSRKHVRALIRELGETAWTFLQPPASPEERRRIRREWQDEMADLPREYFKLVADLLRHMLDLQRPQAHDMSVELYVLDDGGARLVARAERRPGAERCAESGSYVADACTPRNAPTGRPSAEFPLDGNGHTRGVLRLWGFDVAALTDARMGMLDDLLGWLQDDFAHNRFAPLPPRVARDGAQGRPTPR